MTASDPERPAPNETPTVRPPFEAIEPRSSRPSRHGLVVGAALLGTSVVGWLTLSRTKSSDSDFRDLPAAERRALYERTFENLKVSCSYAAGEAVAEHCREQATFILEFPECTASCRELAARFATRPSR